MILTSLVHKENLVRAMLTCKKIVAAGEEIRSARPLLALVLAGLLPGLWWFMFFAWCWMRRSSGARF